MLLAIYVLALSLMGVTGHLTSVSTVPSPRNAQSPSSLGVWFVSSQTIPSGADALMITLNPSVFSASTSGSTEIALVSGFTNCGAVGSIDATKTVLTVGLYDDGSSCLLSSETEAELTISSDLATLDLGTVVGITMYSSQDSTSSTGQGYIVGASQATILYARPNNVDQGQIPTSLTFVVEQVANLGTGAGSRIRLFSDVAFWGTVGAGSTVTLDSGFSFCTTTVTQTSLNELELLLSDSGGNCATTTRLHFTITSGSGNAFDMNSATPPSLTYASDTDTVATELVTYWTVGSQSPDVGVLSIGNPFQFFQGGFSPSNPPSYYDFEWNLPSTFANGFLHIAFDQQVFTGNTVIFGWFSMNTTNCIAEMRSESYGGNIGAQLIISVLDQGGCNPTTTPTVTFSGPFVWPADTFAINYWTWTSAHSDTQVNQLVIDSAPILHNVSSPTDATKDSITFHFELTSSLSDGDKIFVLHKGLSSTKTDTKCDEIYYTDPTYITETTQWSTSTTKIKDTTCSINPIVVTTTAANVCPSYSTTSLQITGCTLTAARVYALVLTPIQDTTNQPIYGGYSSFLIYTSSDTRWSNTAGMFHTQDATESVISSASVVAGGATQVWDVPYFYNFGVDMTAGGLQFDGGENSVITVGSNWEWFVFTDPGTKYNDQASLDVNGNRLYQSLSEFCPLESVRFSIEPDEPFPYQVHFYTDVSCTLKVMRITIDVANLPEGVSFSPLDSSDKYWDVAHSDGDAGTWLQGSGHKNNLATLRNSVLSHFLPDIVLTGTPSYYEAQLFVPYTLDSTDTIQLSSRGCFFRCYSSDISCFEHDIANCLPPTYGVYQTSLWTSDGLSPTISSTAFADRFCGLNGVTRTTDADMTPQAMGPGTSIEITLSDVGGTCSVEPGMYNIRIQGSASTLSSEGTWVVIESNPHVWANDAAEGPFVIGPPTSPIVHQIECTGCENIPDSIRFHLGLRQSPHGETLIHEQLFRIYSDVAFWKDGDIPLIVTTPSSWSSSSTYVWGTSYDYGTTLLVDVYHAVPSDWTTSNGINITIACTSSSYLLDQTGNAPAQFLVQQTNTTGSRWESLSSSVSNLTVTSSTTVNSAIIQSIYFTFVPTQNMQAGDKLYVTPHHSNVLGTFSVELAEAYCDVQVASSSHSDTLVIELGDWTSTCSINSGSNQVLTITYNNGTNPVGPSTAVGFFFWTSVDTIPVETSYRTDGAFLTSSTSLLDRSIGNRGSFNVTFTQSSNIATSSNIIIVAPGLAEHIIAVSLDTNQRAVDGVTFTSNQDTLIVTNGMYTILLANQETKLILTYDTLTQVTDSNALRISTDDVPFTAIGDNYTITLPGAIGFNNITLEKMYRNAVGSIYISIGGFESVSTIDRFTVSFPTGWYTDQVSSCAIIHDESSISTGAVDKVSSTILRFEVLDTLPISSGTTIIHCDKIKTPSNDRFSGTDSITIETWSNSLSRTLDKSSILLPVTGLGSIGDSLLRLDFDTVARDVENYFNLTINPWTNFLTSGDVIEISFPIDFTIDSSVSCAVTHNGNQLLIDSVQTSGSNISIHIGEGMSNDNVESTIRCGPVQNAAVFNFSGTLFIRSFYEGSLLMDTGSIDTPHLINSAPALVSSLADQSLPPNEAVSFSVAYAFLDPENDVLSYSFNCGNRPCPSWLDFSSSSAVFSGTPSLSDHIVYEVETTALDTFGAETSTSFLLSVPNSAPTLSSEIPSQVVFVSVEIQIFLPTRFDDPDNDELTFQATLADGSPLPNWIKYYPNSNQLAGTPTSSDVGQQQVLVLVEDGYGGNLTHTFDLTVENPAADTAPTVNIFVIDQVVNLGENLTYSPGPNAFTDDGDTITYSASLDTGETLPNWIVFDPTLVLFSCLPIDESDVNSYRIKLVATDTLSQSNAQYFTIRVNTIPSVSQILEDQSFQVGSTTTYVIPEDAFSDFDGESLTFAVTLSNGEEVPHWALFDSATRRLTITPPVTAKGVWNFTVSVTDSASQTVSQSLVVVVPNEAPNQVNTITTQQAYVWREFNYALSSTVFEDEDGDTLYFSVSGPSWLNFDEANKVFSGTPDVLDSGSHTVTVTATDTIAAATTSFTIDVSINTFFETILTYYSASSGGIWLICLLLRCRKKLRKRAFKNNFLEFVSELPPREVPGLEDIEIIVNRLNSTYMQNDSKTLLAQLRMLMVSIQVWIFKVASNQDNKSKKEDLDGICDIVSFETLHYLLPRRIETAVVQGQQYLTWLRCLRSSLEISLCLNVTAKHAMLETEYKELADRLVRIRSLIDTKISSIEGPPDVNTTDARFEAELCLEILSNSPDSGEVLSVDFAIESIKMLVTVPWGITYALHLLNTFPSDGSYLELVKMQFLIPVIGSDKTHVEKFLQYPPDEPSEWWYYYGVVDNLGLVWSQAAPTPELVSQVTKHMEYFCASDDSDAKHFDKFYCYTKPWCTETSLFSDRQGWIHNAALDRIGARLPPKAIDPRHDWTECKLPAEKHSRVLPFIE